MIFLVFTACGSVLTMFINELANPRLYPKPILKMGLEHAKQLKKYQ